MLVNSPKEPLLLHIARDVHIGCILGQAMQRLGDFVEQIPSIESDLEQIPCVLMSSRLTGEMSTLHNFMLKLYKDLHATARTLLNNYLPEIIMP